MDASKHDYMIVEVEADRVAKEAMKALKRSRSQCSSAISGVPTWTGQSGAIKKWVLQSLCSWMGIGNFRFVQREKVLLYLKMNLTAVDVLCFHV